MTSKAMDLQEEIEYYAKERVCRWCLGEKSITNDAGKDTEWTENCPVCNVKDECDMSGASEGDR